MSLEARRIHFSYTRSRVPLLRNASIRIGAGEVVGLVGPSGCGKSTLGKVLAGHLRPSRGSITLDGTPPPRSVFSPVQLIYQHPELAVNPRWKLGKTLEESGPVDHGLRAELGIKDAYMNRFPNELSGGELQRFCVLRALKVPTRFIVADEISTMLDVITQSQIWRIILEYAQARRIGILAITHNRHLAVRICTRVIRFEDVGEG